MKKRSVFTIFMAANMLFTPMAAMAGTVNEADQEHAQVEDNVEEYMKSEESEFTDDASENTDSVENETVEEFAAEISDLDDIEEDQEYEEDFTDILENQFEAEAEEIYEDDELWVVEDIEDFKEEETEDVELCEAGRLPSYYPVSHDDAWLEYVKEYYPATRNQGGYGTCWAHAATACAELWAVNHGKSDASVDYSEAHLAYWAQHTLPDTVIDNQDTISGPFSDGGGSMVNFVAKLWGLGAGVADESVVPYSEMSSIAQGGSLPDSTAYSSEIHLLNGHYSTDIDEIKKHIMRNGAVESSIFVDYWYVRDDTDSYYYTGGTKYSNHAVTIVGWDDDYPKENFYVRYNAFKDEYIGKLPEHDGAWLVRNSYSTDTSATFESYFWMSYENEPTIEEDCGLDFFLMDFTDNFRYNKTYHYDGVTRGSQTNFCNIGASVYTATANEELGAVSFPMQGTTRGGDYVINVYVNPKDGNPESGRLAAVKTGEIYPGEGFYTVEFAPVSLNKGDRFSVVLKLGNKNDDITVEYEYKSDLTITSSSEAGRSFLFRDGRWIDYGKENNADVLIYAYTYDPSVPDNNRDGEYFEFINPENPEPAKEEDPQEEPRPVNTEQEKGDPAAGKTDEDSTVVVIPEEKLPNGLQYVDGRWQYITDGRIDTSKYGFVNYSGKFFLVANGTVADVNGLQMDPNDPENWYFCVNGQICEYSGLAMYNDEWFYIDNGWLDTAFSGLVEYNGGLFYVAAGRIVREANGLVLDPKSGNWYFAAYGEIQNQYTGLAQYGGEWFYIVRGMLADTYTGAVSFDGEDFQVDHGMVR